MTKFKFDKNEENRKLRMDKEATAFEGLVSKYPEFKEILHSIPGGRVALRIETNLDGIKRFLEAFRAAGIR